MTVKIKHNKAHVLYKALGYDHWLLNWYLLRDDSMNADFGFAESDKPM